MGICPNCGSWVDEGDICMSCGGGSFNDDCSSVSTWSSSYGGYRSPEDSEERNKRKLKNIKNSYEHKLKKARKIKTMNVG